MWGCQALKNRSSETSQVSIRCVVLFSIKNPFRAEPLFSCEDQFFEGGEFRSKVISSPALGVTSLSLQMNLPSKETELYCQVPALLKSLQMTSPSPVCPFGPAACASSNDPEEMSALECRGSPGNIKVSFSPHLHAWLDFKF